MRSLFRNNEAVAAMATGRMFGAWTLARSEHVEGPTSLSLLPPLLLALASGAFGYWITGHLEALRVYSQWDVWFHADPNVYLYEFSNDPEWFDYRHPIIGLLVQPAVRLFALLFHGRAGLPTELPAATAALALLVAPAASAIRTALLYVALRRLVRRTWPVVLLCVVDLMSFASMLSGGIPETYPLTALCLAWMFLLWSSAERAFGRRHWLAWLAVGVVSCGITVTSVVPLTILLSARLWTAGVDVPRAARVLATTIGAIALIVGSATVYSATHYGYQISMNSVPKLELFYNRPGHERAAELAWAVTHTFTAPMPGRIPTWAGPKENPDYDFVLSYASPYTHGWPSAWRAVVTLASIGLGIWGLLAARVSRLHLAAPALILTFNLGMHLVYGHQYVIYALHWQSSLIWLMAGVAFVPGLARRGDPTLLGMAVLTAVGSLWLATALFANLRLVLH